MNATPDFHTWQSGVGSELTADPLWRMEVYRLALYCYETSWPDVLALRRGMVWEATADQLFRALGSIGANIAEGYSRSSARDRAKYFEYALGSVRESRHWYRGTIPTLGEERIESRSELLGSIARLLMVIIPAERRAAGKR